MSLTLTTIGPRPSSLGGYGPIINEKLLQLALDELEELKPMRVISGGALGWDTALIEAAIRLDIPFELYIPGYDYESKWPSSSQLRFRELMNKANNVRYIGNKYQSTLLYMRNKLLIDDCDMVLALYNGLKSGDTYTCIQYAKKKGKTILNLWSKFNGKKDK